MEAPLGLNELERLTLDVLDLNNSYFSLKTSANCLTAA